MLGLVTSLKMMMVVGALNFAVPQSTPPSENSTFPSIFGPDPGLWISWIVQLDLLSPLLRNPLLKRSKLSSSEASIQISQCGYQSEPPVPSSSSSRLGRPGKVAGHEDCDLVNLFLSSKISVLLWAFPPATALHVSVKQNRIHEARSFSGPNVSLFQHDPIHLGPSMRVSCKQICIVLLHLSSESDFVFRLTQVCPVISVVVCSLLWCSYCILI